MSNFDLNRYQCTNCNSFMADYTDFEEWQHYKCGGLVVDRKERNPNMHPRNASEEYMRTQFPHAAYEFRPDMPEAARVTMLQDYAPMLFLAGPIVGADDWQKRALLHADEWAHFNQQRILILNPRRPDVAHGEFTDTRHAAQVEWETSHLKIANAILFWLDQPATDYVPARDRAFAQTTRFELGEWLAKAPNKVVIGGDRSFSGLRYIRHRIEMGIKTNYLPVSDLRETVFAACVQATAMRLHTT